MTLSDDSSNARLCNILVGLEGDIRQFRQSLEAYERRHSVLSRLGKQSGESLALNHKIGSLAEELCSFFQEARVISILKASDADRIGEMAVKLTSLRDSLEEANHLH